MSWVDPGRLTLQEAEDFFAVIYRGKHHIPSKIRDDGNGMFSVSHYGSLATFDFDELTRLVFLAHERAIRAWVRASQPRCVRIAIAKRLREGDDMTNHHPTVETALAKFRTDDDGPWWKTLRHSEAS